MIGQMLKIQKAPRMESLLINHYSLILFYDDFLGDCGVAIVQGQDIDT
jgi:hypothetical protein